MGMEKGEPLVPLVFDTALVPPAARFGAWRSALSSLDVTQRGADPFNGHARLWMLESLVLTHASVDALRYDRDEARVRADLKDHLAIVVLLEGSFVGDYGRGERVSEAGSVTLLDMRHACWTDATRLEAFIISMPRAFLLPMLEGCDPHGMIATGGPATLLSGFLRTAVKTLPTLTRDHAPAVARTIRDLLADAILDACRSGGAQVAREDALISRVRSYIDDHLAEPIDVAAICAALGVSRSALYRAFGDGAGEGGGVLQQVQRRRLHALRAMLADPNETRPIAELAGAVGFSDKSHLTRVFKREYGCTPGAYRAHGPDPQRAVPVEDVPLVFERWTTLLD
ncbi:helix-turn-helix transcriptional regulator [Sphingomonas sp. Mn802worker]|uniref:helix-turn-helix transcriptional regulator n=1 Tax=Sphingomonas sp. Mn802worker TaxID=629773 RepID=UPI00039A63B9|nr:AraC family transcriptional regulator [Sphingomonas sp. Mn802worker]